MASAVDSVLVKVEAQDNLSKPFERMAKMGAKMGATAEDMGAALKAADKATKDYGVSAHVAQQAFKGLLPEVQDAAEAAKHFGIVMKHQAATGINDTAAAAKEIGDVLGGGTKALRNYDKAAADMADEIDKIKDPAVRAKLAMKALEEAIQRQNSTLGKAKAKFAEMNAALTPIKPLAIAGGAALGGMAAIIGGVLTKAVTTYLGANKKWQASTKKLDAAWQEFLFTLGAALVGMDDAGGGVDDITRKLGKLTDQTQKSSKEIGTFARGMVKVVLYAAQGVAEVVGGVATAVGFVFDLGKNLVLGFVEFTAAVFGGVAELLNAVGQLSDSELAGVRSRINDISKVNDKAFGFQATEQVLSWVEGMRAAADVGHEFADTIGGAVPAAIGKQRKAFRASQGRKGKSGGGAKGKKTEGGDYTSAGYTEEGLGVLDEVMTGDPIAEVGVVFGEAFTGITTGFKSATAEGTQFAEMMDRVNANLFEARSGQVVFDQLNIALGSVADGALRMADALASGSMAIKDIGVHVADSVSDILQSSGKALAEHAIKSGLIFQAFGASLEALAILSPGGMLLAGAGLIAAGLVLKKGLGSGSVSRGSAAKKADSQAAGQIERLGRQMMGEHREEGRVTVLQVGDRQIRGIIRDEVNDGSRRRQYGSLPFSSSTALGG